MVGKRVVLVLSLVVLMMLATSLVASAAGGYHVVRAGETLFSIGRLYGVNPYTIAAVNGLANPNLIYIGQCLQIPGGAAPYHPPAPPAPVAPVARQYLTQTYSWWPTQYTAGYWGWTGYNPWSRGFQPQWGPQFPSYGPQFMQGPSAPHGGFH